MKTLALIPGSFKPPHKGHYEMIKFYSDMVGGTGTVMVFVSKPKLKLNQRIDCFGREVNPDMAEKILKIYTKELSNVEIKVVEGSPVKPCYDLSEASGRAEIIVGASSKGKDLKRWEGMSEWLEQRNPEAVLRVVPFEMTTDMSASDLRAILNKKQEVIKFLPDHLSDSEKDEVYKLLIA